MCIIKNKHYFLLCCLVFLLTISFNAHAEYYLVNAVPEPAFECYYHCQYKQPCYYQTTYIRSVSPHKYPHAHAGMSEYE